MNIIAVPLARHANSARLPYLTYLSQPVAAAATKLSSKPSFAQRAIQYASDMWTTWGRPETASLLNWKRRVHAFGERIMDRIEYEEWALKSIDQVLGPSIHALLSSRLPLREPREEHPTHVAVLYPPSVVGRTSVMESLRSMAHHRAPHHYRLLFYNMVAIPVTAPLFLIPVIPNVFTYYFMWRAWSHWRAYVASKSLESLLQHGLVECKPDDQLDAIYAEAKSHESQHVQKQPNGWTFFLDQDDMASLTYQYALSAQAFVDLRRASQQAIYDIMRQRRQQRAS